MGGVKKAVGSVFGGGTGQTGMFGTGRFKATTRKVEEEPFRRETTGAGTQEELRGKQRKQTERLEETAEGKRPSIAEAQLKQASSRSLAQQLAAAQAQRGGSAAARERALAKGAGEARREVAAQASIDRLKEQQLAEQSLAAQLQAQRAQDIAVAEADRASQQALQDLLVKQNLAAQGLNLSGFESAAAARAGLMQGAMTGFGQLSGLFGQGGAAASMGGTSDKNAKTKIKKEESFEDKLSKSGNKELIIAHNKKQAKKGIELAKSRRDLTSKRKQEAGEKIKQSLEEGTKKGIEARERSASFGKSLAERQASQISDLSMKKSMKSYSDEECKKNIQSEDFNPKSFLDALQAYSYEYKNPEKVGRGHGRYLSVMAQDLEKAGPVGRSMVEQSEDGTKMVNYGKGFGAILAAQAHLNQRLNELEKKKK